MYHKTTFDSTHKIIVSTMLTMFQSIFWCWLFPVAKKWLECNKKEKKRKKLLYKDTCTHNDKDISNEQTWRHLLLMKKFNIQIYAENVWTEVEICMVSTMHIRNDPNTECLVQKTWLEWVLVYYLTVQYLKLVYWWR